MKNAVKYKNDMNKLNFHGLRKNDMNLFMAICSEVKEKGDNTIIIEFDKLRKMSNYTGHKHADFIRDLIVMCKKIMSINCELTDNDGFVLFNIFETFIADGESSTLTIKINPDFLWLLNEFTDTIKGYTIFELQEFVGLKSRYAKNLYRILKQWRTKGEFIFHSIDEFKLKLDVPNSYENKRLKEKIINPAVSEIVKLDKSFKNFKCESLYLKKQGKPLEGYRFTWIPERTKQIDNEKKNKNSKINNFTNFQQRTYDFKELEKDLSKRQYMEDQVDVEELLKNMKSK